MFIPRGTKCGVGCFGLAFHGKAREIEIRVLVAIIPFPEVIQQSRYDLLPRPQLLRFANGWRQELDVSVGSDELQSW